MFEKEKQAAFEKARMEEEARDRLLRVRSQLLRFLFKSDFVPIDIIDVC